MNKYLIYRWSFMRNRYWPLFSCDTLDFAKLFVRNMRICPTEIFIIVPNTNPRYAQNKK